MIKMSDGITDTYRESRFKPKPISSSTTQKINIPKCCKKRPERQQQTDDALEFVKYLMNAEINHIALENPVGCISTQIRKPDQVIQPWQFGHPESKTTCLWLKNLPKLQPTNILEKPSCGYWNNQTPSGQNKLGPSKDRWKKRSLTYKGIGEAMANQWSKFIIIK